MGVAVRVAPAQPSQSLAQLVHVHAAVLVTIQLLEEATPALSPLRIARAPPHGARGGGEARQRRPQRGLRGSPSPPGPRRASSAATATAASALPVWLWHLQEPVTANRRRPRRNWRLLPRPAWGGEGAGGGAAGVGRCVGDALILHSLGSARVHSGERGWRDQWSQFCFQSSALRASVYPLPQGAK